MVTVRGGGPLFLKVTSERLRRVPVVERELEHMNSWCAKLYLLSVSSKKCTDFEDNTKI